MMSNLEQEKEWIEPSKKPPKPPTKSMYKLPLDSDVTPIKAPSPKLPAKKPPLQPIKQPVVNG